LGETYGLFDLFDLNTDKIFKVYYDHWKYMGSQFTRQCEGISRSKKTHWLLPLAWVATPSATEKNAYDIDTNSLGTPS
jgi:hypothetical protein